MTILYSAQHYSAHFDLGRVKVFAKSSRLSLSPDYARSLGARSIVLQCSLGLPVLEAVMTISIRCRRTCKKVGLAGFCFRHPKSVFSLFLFAVLFCYMTVQRETEPLEAAKSEMGRSRRKSFPGCKIPDINPFSSVVMKYTKDPGKLNCGGASLTTFYKNTLNMTNPRDFCKRIKVSGIRYRVIGRHKGK